MGKNEIKKFWDFIKEATDATTTATTPTTDNNITSLQNNVAAYKKYSGRVIAMFNNAKAEDMEKIAKSFEDFIKSLPDTEKGASDMLRSLYASEKIKLDIKNFEDQKIVIDQQIQQRMKELKEITDNLK